MKLPIKKKYFDEIKAGKKMVEYRDAHITFVCEETGESLTKEVLSVSIHNDIKHFYPEVLKDERTICFVLDDLVCPYCNNKAKKISNGMYKCVMCDCVIGSEY